MCTGTVLLADLALLLFRVRPERKCSPLASCGDSSVENASSKQIRAKGHSEAIVSVKQLPALFLSSAPVNSQSRLGFVMGTGRVSPVRFAGFGTDFMKRLFTESLCACITHCPGEL